MFSKLLAGKLWDIFCPMSQVSMTWFFWFYFTNINELFVGITLLCAFVLCFLRICLVHVYRNVRACKHYFHNKCSARCICLCFCVCLCSSASGYIFGEASHLSLVWLTLKQESSFASRPQMLQTEPAFWTRLTRPPRCPQGAVTPHLVCPCELVTCSAANVTNQKHTHTHKNTYGWNLCTPVWWHV